MNKKLVRKWIRMVWVMGGITFLLWQWVSYQAWGIDPSVLMSDDQIRIRKNDDMISLVPLQPDSLEVIFFPGALVDPDAYVPLARKLADQGYPTHIIKMPMRMSTQGYKRILGLFELASAQKRYVLGGHSQGAKMAAQFAYEYPDLLAGLYLLGTSHPRDIDMSNMSIPTLKLYAEHDGLASVPEVLTNQAKLPANAHLIMIKGGNHSQFASIGKLFQDNRATIGMEQQQEETATYLLKFLSTLGKDKAGKAGETYTEPFSYFYEKKSI